LKSLINKGFEAFLFVFFRRKYYRKYRKLSQNIVEMQVKMQVKMQVGLKAEKDFINQLFGNTESTCHILNGKDEIKNTD